MMLSVCQSIGFVSDRKQSKVVRRGIVEMIKRTQNVNAGYGVTSECLNFFEGWNKQVLEDKCKNNQAMETVCVNYPESSKKKSKCCHGHGPKECNTYAYAAYLPPGLHHFLIYCPKTKRLFV